LIYLCDYYFENIIIGSVKISYLSTGDTSGVFNRVFTCLLLAFIQNLLKMFRNRDIIEAMLKVWKIELFVKLLLQISIMNFNLFLCILVAPLKRLHSFYFRQCIYMWQFWWWCINRIVNFLILFTNFFQYLLFLLFKFFMNITLLLYKFFYRLVQSIQLFEWHFMHSFGHKYWPWLSLLNASFCLLYEFFSQFFILIYFVEFSIFQSFYISACGFIYVGDIVF